MKIISLIFALAMASTLCLSQTKSNEVTPLSAAEQEIVNLERERLKAFALADKAAFERLVTDDLTMTHGYGEVFNKAQEMAVMRASTPERPLPALSIEDPKVKIYGDVAVMTGSLVETNRDGRRELVLRLPILTLGKNSNGDNAASQNGPHQETALLDVVDHRTLS